jgi:hypothetical protein
MAQSPYDSYQPPHACPRIPFSPWEEVESLFPRNLDITRFSSITSAAASSRLVGAAEALNRCLALTEKLASTCLDRVVSNETPTVTVDEDEEAPKPPTRRRRLR